jgi:CheY-like chemotaxis protein
MSKHILYIEDDEMQTTLAKMSVQRGSYEFDIDFAETGREGIDAFDPARHCLVVIDYNLPDMDAPEIVEELLLKNGPFPAVFLSGAYLESHLSKAESLNVKACITKGDITENLYQIATLL